MLELVTARRAGHHPPLTDGRRSVAAMGNPVAVVRTTTQRGEFLYRSVMTFCPGCRHAHPFRIEVAPGAERSPGEPWPVWSWDGNLEQPTISPSLLCYSSVHLCPEPARSEPCPDPDACGERSHLVLADGPDAQVLGHSLPHTHTVDPAWGNCHSFLTAGRWRFLEDSGHALAGQTVDMVALPDWLA